MGTKTPEKAGSVSKETQPRTPEIDTTVPRSRSLPCKHENRPIDVKPANKGSHHTVICELGRRANPSAPTMPSTDPKQPSTNPAPLARPVRAASSRRVCRPSRPPKYKAGIVTLNTDTRAPVNPEMPGLSKKPAAP